MQNVHKFKDEKTKVVVDYDDFNESPRDLYDNLGTLIEWHRKLDFGDKKINADSYASQFDVIKKEVENLEDIVYLPVYMYEHGGATISTTPFSSMWDSGQVGWIYAKKEENLSESQIEEILNGEIKLLDEWIRGDVYSVKIYTRNKCDHCGHVHEELEDDLYGLYGYSEVANYIQEMEHLIGTDFTEEIVGKL